MKPKEYAEHDCTTRVKVQKSKLRTPQQVFFIPLLRNCNTLKPPLSG
ncbi:hypothetical protein SynA1825c_00661 [Synechococcus sp. A18-25c]|nr:hypothetical protein SynA1825c_00661 [Synechococcus sp. A18-25c]